MNDFGHHHARRLALCLTLILCGLTGVVLVVADEMRHTVILPPPPTLFALIPLAAVTVATLALPATGGGAPAAWGPAVRWLQVDALAVLAMAPFLAWQARLPANLYVSVVAAMAVGLAAVYLFRLCGLLAMLFAAAGDRAAVGWTRLARILMLYGNLTVVITVGLLILGEQALFRIKAVESLRALWGNVHGGLRALLMTAVAAVLTLLAALLARAICDCTALPATPPDGRPDREPATARSQHGQPD